VAGQWLVGGSLLLVSAWLWLLLLQRVSALCALCAQCHSLESILQTAPPATSPGTVQLQLLGVKLPLAFILHQPLAHQSPSPGFKVGARVGSQTQPSLVALAGHRQCSSDRKERELHSGLLASTLPGYPCSIGLDVASMI
jgi:hypothetical protein